MMKNFKRAISSFFTAAFAVIYMALNTTTAFAAMIDERPKTDDEVTAEALYVHTDNPEADAVFNAYVDVAVKMVGTDYYEDGFVTTSGFVLCCGGTQEQADQLDSMAKMEQLLWMATYIDLCFVLKHKEETLNTWESLEAWAEKEVAGSKIAFLLKNAPDKEEQMNAYKQLVKWQYDYYVTNKSFYCFFTGQGLWLVYSMNDYSAYFGGESSQTGTTIASQSNGGETSSTTVTTVSTSKLVPLTTTVATTAPVSSNGIMIVWLTVAIVVILLLVIALVVILLKKRK